MRVLSWQVTFPACLTAQQRAALHAAAEENEVPHQSSGTDSERHITIGHMGQAEVRKFVSSRQTSAWNVLPLPLTSSNPLYGLTGHLVFTFRAPIQYLTLLINDTLTMQDSGFLSVTNSNLKCVSGVNCPTLSILPSFPGGHRRFRQHDG